MQTEPDQRSAEIRWLEVRVAGSENRQAVIDALFSLGSQGIQELETGVVAHLSTSVSPDEINEVVLRADPSARVTIAASAPVDWSTWRAAVRSHRVGSLTVAPPWLAGNADPRTTIIIDPAMAFGTGEHATTRGVIRLMHGVVGSDSTVIDLGAGSAILSIAAAKLGARRVVAVELDPDATANAVENIRVNGVNDRVHFIEGDAFTLLPLFAPADVILANILSSVLRLLLPAIRDSLAPGGCAILSGILREERQMMLAEIAQAELQVSREDVEDEWWSVLIARS